MNNLIIPCYNEAGRFNRKLFFIYFDELVDVHFIFVNDGSTDDTKGFLENIRLEGISKNPKIPITILNLKKNAGKAEAVRQGVLFSLQSPNTKYIAYFDADFSAPLTEITELLKGFEEDPSRMAILGSRIKKAGSLIQRSSVRHYTGRIMATIVNNLLLEIAIYDTQCGAKVFSRNCAELIFREPFVSRWLFDIELISRLQVHYSVDSLRKIIYEHPLKEWREMGNSKIRFRDLMIIPYQLLIIYNKQRDDFKKNQKLG